MVFTGNTYLDLRPVKLAYSPWRISLPDKGLPYLGGLITDVLTDRGIPDTVSRTQYLFVNVYFPQLLFQPPFQPFYLILLQAGIDDGNDLRRQPAFAPAAAVVCVDTGPW